jgi:hypothetical protein
MADTPRLGLALLDGGQAQKHVTVNEALSRLDALASASVASRRHATPPAATDEGSVWLVAAPAGGAWAGAEGRLALRQNGGWVFHAPEPGRRAFFVDEGAEAVFDGAAWRGGASAILGGASASLSVAKLDHVVTSGATSTTVAVIPDKAVVIGVTARVLSPLTGAGVTAWRLGVPGASGRYGSGYGVAAGSFAVGITGSPTGYFAPTPLLVEAVGGAFSGGVIRFAVSFLALEPPA